MLGFPPLHGHLRFDFVDFLERNCAIVRFGRHAALKKRGSGTRVLPRHGFPLAHFAQHVELALAYKVVTPLALDHFLEQLLAQGLFLTLFLGVQIRPVRRWIADELHNLGKQAR